MPPTAALIVCVILIALVLSLDRSVGVRVSPALWISTIWMLIMGSRMVSQWFTVGMSQQSLESYQEGSPIDRNIFLFLIIAAASVLITRRISFRQFFQRNVWISLFILYCGATIAWSDFPLVSFKRYLKDIGNLLMVLVVLTDPYPVQALSTLCKRCAYILIPLSVAIYKYFPELGRGYSMWTGELFVTGVTNNKNSLGALALVCSLTSLWTLLLTFRRQGPFRRGALSIAIMVAMLAMTLWTLVISHSATSLACAAVGSVILVAAPLIRTRPLVVVAFSALALLAVGYIELWAGGLMNLVTGSLGRDSTLTGRTELWADVLAMTTHPVTGVGFGSFWLGDRLEVLWDKYWWHPTEAHNGYLEVYLELGYIGLFLLACVFASTIRKTIAAVRTGSDVARLQLAVVGMVAFYNFTEAGLRVDLLIYLMFLFGVIDMSYSYVGLAGHRGETARLSETHGQASPMKSGQGTQPQNRPRAFRAPPPAC